MSAEEGTSTQRSYSPDEAMEIARRLIAKGDLDNAAIVLSRVLEAMPRNANALNWLASIRSHRGQFEEALALIERAIEEAPQAPGIHNNHGNILVDCGKFADAAQAYHLALKLDPRAVEPLNNLAVLMRAFRQFEEAETLLARAVELKPDFGLAHYNLSLVLGACNRNAEAVHHAFQSLIHMPHNTISPHVLAIAHVQNNDHAAALGVIKEWLAREPDNGEALHVLAALEGERPPERASDVYVESVFDRFAASFDAKLAKLGYRAPEIVGELARSLRPDADASLRVLDAGCGTGLCGAHLRPLSAWLAGVDLSIGMLAKADKTGIYDQLVKAELTEFLEAAEEPFDIVVSADTLCYFGALDRFAAAASAALSPGGLLAFTLEASASPDQPYRLAVSGRYQHAEAYVRSVLTANGFAIEHFGADTLRFENAEPVTGHIVAARRIAKAVPAR